VKKPKKKNVKNWWDWLFMVPGHGSANDPEPNANGVWDSPPHNNPPPLCRSSEKGRVILIPISDGTESPSTFTKAKVAPRMDQIVVPNVP